MALTKWSLTFISDDIIFWAIPVSGIFIVDKFLFSWQILMKFDERYHPALSKLTTSIYEVISWVFFSTVQFLHSIPALEFNQDSNTSIYSDWEVDTPDNAPPPKYTDTPT